MLSQNFLDKNHISGYLNKRIQQNAHYYLKKDVLQTRFDIGHTEENIFFLVYFAVSRLLDDGNTVLVLNQDNHQANSYGLSQWQMALLSPILDMFDDVMSALLNFGDIFTKIDDLKDDKLALATLIDAQRQSLTALYQQSQLVSPKKSSQPINAVQMQNQIDELSLMLMWALRFYFYSKHIIQNSLDLFVQKLNQHYAFCEIYRHICDKPLVYYYDKSSYQVYIWLNRAYYAERTLLSCINKICATSLPIINIQELTPKLNDEQVQAVQKAITKPLSIITGGPGTGKTFTVAQIVIALNQNHTSHTQKDSLALVAPTGKAAQRMKESLQQSLPQNSTIVLPEPMTIHRLLGMGSDGVPRYHQTNQLPFDMIIVDEASMLGIELAAKLMAAIKEGARLILLGDVHQLSAVDAGAVLSDLCRLMVLQDAKTYLTQSRRFDATSGVGKLANLVNQSSMVRLSQIEQIITQYPTQLSYTDIEPNTQDKYTIYQFYHQLAQDYLVDGGYFFATKQLRFVFYQLSSEQKNEQVKRLNHLFNQYRILTASHLSGCGDKMINVDIENRHREYLGITSQKATWYHGRVVMVLKNRYDLGLFNGDIGICLQSGRKAHELSVYFDGETIKSFAVNMLDGDIVSTAYAMTVHKSQGSEFHKVAIVFDDNNQRLLSKELIYTAITRAKNSVHIYSTSSALLSAVNTPTVRQTGLTVGEKWVLTGNET